jgi:hypothetical protein
MIILILYCAVCYLISLGVLISESNNSEPLSIFEFIFSPFVLPIAFGCYISDYLINKVKEL